jgi:hypothetical protein
LLACSDLRAVFWAPQSPKPAEDTGDVGPPQEPTGIDLQAVDRVERKLRRDQAALREAEKMLLSKVCHAAILHFSHCVANLASVVDCNATVVTEPTTFLQDSKYREFKAEGEQALIESRLFHKIVAQKYGHGAHKKNKTVRHLQSLHYLFCALRPLLRKTKN